MAGPQKPENDAEVQRQCGRPKVVGGLLRRSAGKQDVWAGEEKRTQGTAQGARWGATFVAIMV